MDSEVWVRLAFAEDFHEVLKTDLFTANILPPGFAEIEGSVINRLFLALGTLRPAIGHRLIQQTNCPLPNFTNKQDAGLEVQPLCRLLQASSVAVQVLYGPIQRLLPSVLARMQALFNLLSIFRASSLTPYPFLQHDFERMKLLTTPLYAGKP